MVCRRMLDELLLTLTFDGDYIVELSGQEAQVDINMALYETQETDRVQPIR